MKISLKALVAAAALSGLLPGFAQENPAATPAPAERPAAFATEPKPAAAAQKPEAEPNSVAAGSKAALPAPAPGISRQNHVNVRGQATLNSEVIARLEKGQEVTVLEEIMLKKPKEDEPSRWYRIALPTNVAVWVHSMFIDPDTKTVKPRRLNVRGGPGENYSIVGRIESGTAVQQIDARGPWLKIDPPTNSYGFVAAHLIERKPGVSIVAAPPAAPETNDVAAVPPPATTTTVPETTPPPIAEAPATTPSITASPVPAPAESITPPPPAVTPAPAETTPPAPAELVRKVVSREGVLRGSVSIQAPTYFALRSLDTGKTINYVHSPSADLNLQEYKGQRVIITGEEVLDERWQNTPVLIVESLQTVP